MKPYLSLFLFFLLFACGNDKPKDILPAKKMQAVQWDLMMADEMVDYYRTSDTSYKAEQKRQEYYTQIFKSHQTTKQAFDKTIDYYAAHPGLLKELLDSLHKKAERLQTKSDSLTRLADTASNKKDTSKLKKDTSMVRKDTSLLKPIFDSLKRKKFLKPKA